MTYAIKIDRRETHDGIRHWLQWEGHALRAYAEKTSETSMFRSVRIAIVPDKDALLQFISAEDRRYTTPENYARHQCIDRVRNDFELYRRRLFPDKWEGTSDKSVEFNGGW